MRQQRQFSEILSLLTLSCISLTFSIKEIIRGRDHIIKLMYILINQANYQNWLFENDRMTLDVHIWSILKLKFKLINKKFLHRYNDIEIIQSNKCGCERRREKKKIIAKLINQHLQRPFSISNLNCSTDNYYSFVRNNFEPAFKWSIHSCKRQ